MPRKPNKRGRHTPAKGESGPNPPQSSPSKGQANQPGLSFFPPQTEQTEHGQADEDDFDFDLDVRPNDGPELEPEPDDLRYTHKWPGVKEVARVLRRYKGNLVKCSQALGVSRTTLYDWLAKNEPLQRVRAEGIDVRLDIAESKMDELIEGVTMVKYQRDEEIIYTRAPSFSALKFLLQTLGKPRGFVIDNKPALVEDGPDLSDALFEELRKGKEKFHDGATEADRAIQQGTD